MAHQHRLVFFTGCHPLQEGLGGQLEPPVLDDGLHQDGLVPLVQPPSPEWEEELEFRSDLDHYITLIYQDLVLN